jgi:hypothetical protein
MTMILFGLVWTVVFVAVFGLLLLLRKSAQRRAELRISTARQLQPRKPPTEQSAGTWTNNKHMHMR